MTKITPNEIIELVKRLPDSEKHIYESDGIHVITTEWLVGCFSGRSFEAETIEKAAAMLIEYFYEHINHKSMVGSSVTNSGFPNLIKVEKYCTITKDTEG